MTNEYMFDMRGRTALVTGASRGIGRAIAIALGKAGASLIVHGRSHSEALQELVDELQYLGVSARAWVFDLQKTEGLQEALEAEQFNVDILVLNASMEIREDILAIQREHIEQQMQCNFNASLLILLQLIPAMCERGWGRVIGIGSIQEEHVNPQLAVYAALKTAQTHFLKTLATQVAEQGVTVNCVAPGAIYTDRNNTVLADPAFRQRVEAKIPMGRIGQPQDCVGAVLFFASEWSSYITGARLPVDGGFHVP